MIIFSFGGGVQSWAITALVARGELPKPDLAVMANTGRECASTWNFLQVHYSRLPFVLEIVNQPVPSLYWQTGEHDFMLPAYSQAGKVRGFCSGKWKRDTIRHYLLERGITEYVQWLGLSADEWKRIKPDKLKSVQNCWPLIELRLTRGDCLKLDLDYLGAYPPKSRCWCCPNQGRSEWLSLTPAELIAAHLVDATAFASHGFRLHSFYLPLLEAVGLQAAQGDLFGDECDEGGYCYT